MQTQLIKKRQKKSSYLIFGTVLGQIGPVLKYSIKNMQGLHSFAEMPVVSKQWKYLYHDQLSSQQS